MHYLSLFFNKILYTLRYVFAHLDEKHIIGQF